MSLLCISGRDLVGQRPAGYEPEMSGSTSASSHSPSSQKWRCCGISSAESFHQLVWWSLFVSSMLSCQKLTSNTAAKCLTAVCSSYSTTFGRQRHWRAKTKLSLHFLPTVSVSEQACLSACRDCSVTCWLSVLVTALPFVFDTADILNCDHYFEKGSRLKWGQAECSFYLPLCFPNCSSVAMGLYYFHVH